MKEKTEYGCGYLNFMELETINANRIIVPKNGKITWHLREDRMTSDMQKLKVIVAFEKAFKHWEKVFHPIQFEPVSKKKNAQIIIGFYRNGDKELPVPFEKQVLAYAFAPGFHAHASDMFFDDRWDWSEMHKPGKINLFKVAVHEMGHTFNLGHSKDIRDIMYPTYQPNDSVIITNDTIKTIMELYGKYI